MTVVLFLFVLAVLFAAVFAWAFRALPREEWQIIAAVPVGKPEQGEWQGLNLTYYGFFQATSNVLAVVMVFVLLGAVGVSTEAVFVLIAALFALCWPAAKLIARVVEKKKHTFTVGGALFAGTLGAPWIVELLNQTLSGAVGRIPVIPSLAVAAVAYAYGEGLGRLACISFGCCYGKGVDELSPRMRRLFTGFNFTFEGATKKAVYAGRLEGARLVPIQAITSIILIVIALAGTYLFLKSRFVSALLLTMTATQLWRFGSETLRADARGKADSISAYQVMALLMVIYAAGISYIFPAEAVSPVAVASGLTLLWNPLTLLFCQALWLIIFLVTGRSSVTGSTLSFFVHYDRI